MAFMQSRRMAGAARGVIATAVMTILLTVGAGANITQNPPNPTGPVREPVQSEIALPELDRAMRIYRDQIETIREESRRPLEHLNRQYLQALRQLEQDLRERGDLRNVLLVRNEIDRFERDPASEIMDAAAPPETMRTLRNTLETHRKTHLDQKGNRITVLTQRFVQHLNSLKTELTRQDRIAEALLVEAAIADALTSPYLVPVLKLAVEAGGRGVAAAIVQTQGPAAQKIDATTYRLEADTEYEFRALYTDDTSGRRWQPATLKLTADWRGRQTRRITLQEMREPSPEGLLFHYAFVEDSGSEIRDQSGNGNHGRAHNIVFQNLTGIRRRRAAVFQRGHIDSPVLTDIGFRQHEDATIALWYNIRNCQSVFSLISGRRGHDGLSFAFQQDNMYHIHLRTHHWARFAATKEHGTWVHLTLVRSKGAWQLFEDAQALEVASSRIWPDGGGLLPGIALRFGNDYVFPHWLFDGYMTDIRFYRRALDLDEIALLAADRP